MSREEIYKEALTTLANFDEHTEDYYGGVSISYSRMVNDMIAIARRALGLSDEAANQQERTRCEIRTGCCENHPETAYNLHLSELKKVIPAE